MGFAGCRREGEGGGEQPGRGEAAGRAAAGGGQHSLAGATGCHSGSSAPAEGCQGTALPDKIVKVGYQDLVDSSILSVGTLSDNCPDQSLWQQQQLSLFPKVRVIPFFLTGFGISYIFVDLNELCTAQAISRESVVQTHET